MKILASFILHMLRACVVLQVILWNVDFVLGFDNILIIFEPNIRQSNFINLPFLNWAATHALLNTLNLRLHRAVVIITRNGMITSHI